MKMMIQYTDDNQDYDDTDYTDDNDYTNDTDDNDVDDDIGDDDGDENYDKRKKLIKHSKTNPEVKIIMEM